MRKRGHTQGLDQIGPTQAWKKLPVQLKRGQFNVFQQARASASQRRAPITLSDHLFSSDEIKVKEDS